MRLKEFRRNHILIMSQIYDANWGSLSSTTPSSVQHISSTQKGHSISAHKIPHFHTHLSSTPKTPRFNTKNPSVPHQKPPQFNTHLSSTLKNPQFNKPLSSTQALWPIRFFWYFWWRFFGLKLRAVWNWAVFGVEVRGFGVELRSFWCGTERFRVLKRCGPCVEPMCWTEGVLPYLPFPE